METKTGQHCQAFEQTRTRKSNLIRTQRQKQWLILDAIDFTERRKSVSMCFSIFYFFHLHASVYYFFYSASRSSMPLVCVILTIALTPEVKKQLKVEENNEWRFKKMICVWKKLKTRLNLGINRAPGRGENLSSSELIEQYSTMKLLIVALCLAVGPNIFIRVSENHFEIINSGRWWNENRQNVVIGIIISIVSFNSIQSMEINHYFGVQYLMRFISTIIN